MTYLDGKPGDPALGLETILDEKGLADPEAVPELTGATWPGLYRWMVLARQMDARLMAMQRQGRIALYAESQGHEATVFGSAPS